MHAHLTTTDADIDWNERDIVQRLRAGDESAFEALVRRYSGRMLAVARRLLRGDEEEARDAVQDALVSAFKAVHHFAGDAQVGTWLHRIVVNAALMRLRSRRRHPECSIEDLLPVFGPDGHRVFGADQQPAADRQLEREQLLRVVRKCVAELPDGYREVYVLRDVEELSTEEVAAALATTPNAVKIRLHRARQALITLVRKRLEAVGS